MTDAEIIAAAISGAALLVGIFALQASRRSARSDEQSLDRQKVADHRDAVVKIARTAAEISAARKALDDRAAQLNRAYSDLAIIAGQFGGSLQAKYGAIIDGKLGRAEELANHAALFARATPDAIPIDDSDRVLIALTRDAVEIQAILTEMTHELERLQSEIARATNRQ